MSKRILVTGSEGMVGSNLVTYLEGQGYTVIEFEGDTTLKRDWNKHLDSDIDFIIHLAALAGVRPSFNDPEGYYKNNVVSMEKALDFSAFEGARLIYASSSNAYEWWGNPYAATKKMNELQADCYRDACGSIGMRFHTIWPGREDMLYRKLQKGEVEYINVNHKRDFVHVSDVVRAIEVLIENFDDIEMEHPVVDIGTGKSYSVKEVAELMGFDGEYRYDNPAGERVHTRADISVLTEYDWIPVYDILNKDHHEDSGSK